MGTHKPYMAESIRTIREILLQDCDPIGVQGVPEAVDEYDSYVRLLYGILRKHPSEPAVIDFLYHIETDLIGLSTSRVALHPVATKLLQIDLSHDEVFQ